MERTTVALYRGLMRAAKRLQKQVDRHGAQKAFPKEELEALKEADSEAEEFLQESESQPGMLFQAVRKNFTHPPEGPAAEAKLDQGIRALSVINGRVSVLERMAADNKSETVTDGVRVTVEARKVSEKPQSPHHLFQYHVTIVNEGVQEPVTLVSRYWRIMDFDGTMREVSGHGVQGKQPRIEAGSRFAYQSAVPLMHERGSMWGQYMMVTESGRLIDAEIQPFALE